MKTLLVTVDSLRYDHYEYMENTRSFLGESHPQAYATATATLGTFPNVFTGTYTKSNEIESSFVEELDSKTIGITTNNLVSERYGYDVGFDYFTSPTNSTEEGLKKAVAESLPEGRIYRGISRIYSLYQKISPGSVSKSFRPTEAVIEEFIDAVSGEEWFGWIHLMEPHHPYDPDETNLSREEAQAISRRAIAGGVEEEAAEIVRDLYRQEVIEMDKQLERLWQWLPDDCRVILTGDHGEMLGEDGRWGHPGLLRPETLHIPFSTNFDPELGSVVSSIDIPSLILGEEYREGEFHRETAYASHGEKAAAIEGNQIANPDGVVTLDGERTEDSSLKHKQERFEPSGIVKEDAILEDLEDLGYV
ncbi:MULTISPECIES: sulfatase-like hydrolase/transferase [Halobacterium]|uniref:sulfatase-like hydrolase/transferase n=1 Tax=Halobacterium TaxID=2239 RepID=UPI0009E6ED92|nr:MULTISPECIES: sulfatase-like hydrolase/transferase [Halobacterium]MCG1003034.1 sulfatase-like hydrolase/transferase [Halobacterium noricense]